MNSAHTLRPNRSSRPRARPRRAREVRPRHPATGHEPTRQLTMAITREMNNLLCGIAGLSEIFQQGPDGSQKLTEVFALIHESSNRLGTLIAHLKLLHRRAAGEATYLNLSRTVRGLFAMFAPLLAASVAVELDLPTEELAVYVDEAQLRRVLLDLTLELRDALRNNRTAAHKLRVGIRSGADATVRLTLAAGDIGDVMETTAPDDAPARLADACACLGEMGGRFTRRTDTEFLLDLPVVTSAHPSCISYRHV